MSPHRGPAATTALLLAVAAAACLPLVAAAAAWPVEVESACFSELGIYLLYRLPAASNGSACLDVPAPGLCQEYVPLAAGASFAAAYASSEPLAWALLEDTDSYARPANHTDGDPSLQYATVFDEPCEAGTEGCLPKFQVDVSQGPVVFACDDPYAPLAPAPAPT